MKIKIYQRVIINLTFLLLFCNFFNRTFAEIIKKSSHETRANTFYVKFAASPFTSSADHIEAQHANFHKELNKRGIDVKIKDVFERYANGISIEIDERHVKRI